MAIEIHGYCDPRFAVLRDAFRANFEEGHDIGASLGATYQGRLVVDIWAGHADPDRKVPWQKDTIVPVASTTKIIMMIGMLVALDRGLLDLDQTVSHYWPAFAQGGKEKVTVRDAITHQAGVPGFEVPLTHEEAIDWNVATTRLAAEPHWFGGERRLCYHGFTYGFLLGELIRRVDGRRPRRFLTEEVLARVGADFHVGLSSPDLLERLSAPTFPGVPAIDGIPAKIMGSIDMTRAFTWERMSSENPSGVGYGNGRAVALACGLVANKGVWEGQRILSPGIIALAGTEQVYARCPYLGVARLGLGFGLDSKEFPAASSSSMHWGGFGGSFGSIEPDADFSIGFTPNRWLVPAIVNGQLENEPRWKRLKEATRALLASL
jgi:CubicO group peptidase (beta-lactamase class C family)